MELPFLIYHDIRSVLDIVLKLMGCSGVLVFEIFIEHSAYLKMHSLFRNLILVAEFEAEI